MLTKSCSVAVKAAGPDDDLEEGVFEAIVSVFGNRDSYGDVVQPGAFKTTLAEWKASGDPIPVYWSHRMDDPDFNIGEVLEAKETEAGLWVRARLDLENPKAQQVYRLLKGRRVTQFSFAYDVVAGKWIEEVVDGDQVGYYSLDELKVYEVGPTPIGANQETELLAVKSAALAAHHLVAGVKAGRVLSSKNETTLRDALEQLNGSASAIKNVLAALDKESDEGDGKATAPVPGKAQEPATATAEDPGPTATVDLSDVDLLDLEVASA